MKAVVAMDSFKGCLASMEAGRAAEEGIRRADPGAEVKVYPLADGGEGTVDALIAGMGGREQRISVTGPLGTMADCTYGVIEEKKTAVIEMACAAGLTLVPQEKRNPMNTTTYGVGELIRDAVGRGCRKFIIGIGGSATNDGGIGMLQALGFGFSDKNGRQAAFGAKGLADLACITDQDAMKELKDCRFRIACDVSNVLCGPQGCSAVYGPQKGADKAMIAKMDRWMENYARLAEEKYAGADMRKEGTGAAGGLGFAFLTFLNGTLEPGVDIVLEETGIERDIKDADLVITGEGRMDGQTAMGKAPLGAARLAKKYGKPVIALTGSVAEEAAGCYREGIDAIFSILREPASPETAMNPFYAKRNLAFTAEQVCRLWKAGNGYFSKPCTQSAFRK